jgi:hypothetical protein
MKPTERESRHENLEDNESVGCGASEAGRGTVLKGQEQAASEEDAISSLRVAIK